MHILSYIAVFLLAVFIFLKYTAEGGAIAGIEGLLVLGLLVISWRKFWNGLG